MAYLLDTNVCVDVLKGHPRVCARLATVSPADCAVSAVTAFELLMGIQRCAQPEMERMKLGKLFGVVAILSFDTAAAAAAARVRHALEAKGQRIGPYDLLIAGQALGGGFQLVTNNTREFDRVEGLQILDWRDEN